MKRVFRRPPAGCPPRQGAHVALARAKAYAAALGRRPRLWFVEDRLETLAHVAIHLDLGGAPPRPSAIDMSAPYAYGPGDERANGPTT